jgi:hypothetical protein
MVLNMTDIILVTELEYAKRICSWIKQHLYLVSFDIEGVNLGREGKITLLQIGTSQHRVFCFDVLALGNALFQYLKPIFESESICKLCYDCRTDGDVLKTMHGVNLKCVYDIQVLYTFLFQKEGDPFLKGLYHVLKSPGIIGDKNSKRVMRYKKEIKDSLQNVGTEIFLQRPVSKELLTYCVSDVVYLYKMFNLWASHVEFNVVVQASMYRLNKYCNRIRSKKMYYVDFKKCPWFCTTPYMHCQKAC